ncbi:hypothetical protein HRR83_002244 [Exophiala dermatitidis]|nr:hypothetical protein HRR74_002321 [Exophiala dermatitidis]KAJ4525603.1 hypothetical protein HRR73_002334 [Exophiala dermatitidis]KAJ4536920.1 hypothetical protein HRR76_004946 [Exophiala dermatitidis]KAJ4568784.1 hypothetical protein HRR81_006440 [Exophiala dermatitidis]KAJ4586446.1 hypothetical protein HRR82_002063 [Exophiala dermatitidis]
MEREEQTLVDRKTNFDSAETAPSSERPSDAVTSQPRRAADKHADLSKPRFKHLERVGPTSGASQQAERAMAPPARQDLGLVHGKLCDHAVLCGTLLTPVVLGRTNLRNMVMI